jgi:hypothetical protein
MSLRKPTETSTKTASRMSKVRLAAMIEEATVDAYGDSEQTTGWYTMLEEHLALPFETTMLGVLVKVVALDVRGDNGSSPSARAVASDSLSPFLICRFHRPSPKESNGSMRTVMAWGLTRTLATAPARA